MYCFVLTSGSLCDQREQWRSLASPFKHSCGCRPHVCVGRFSSRYRVRASLDKLGMNSLTASAVLLASGSLGAFTLLPSGLLPSSMLLCYSYLSALIGFSKKSLYASRIPSSNSVLYVHPSFVALLTSSSLRGVPLGREMSHLIAPSKPTTRATSSVSALMVSSLPVPALTVDVDFAGFIHVTWLVLL